MAISTIFKCMFYVVVLFCGILPAVCQNPGRAIINESCFNDCSGKANLPCKIIELPFPCFYPKAHYKDFPSPPKNVNVQVINDTKTGTWLVNLTWHLPYDYSYRAVKGFQLSVNTIYDQRAVRVPCYIIKLGTVNWTQVEDVHDLLFHFSCLRYPYHHLNRTVVLTLYSIPKASKKPRPVRKWVILPGTPSMGPKNLWSPVINTMTRKGKVYVNFSPPFKDAKYHEICLVTPNIKLSACLKRKNITDPSQEVVFSDVQDNTTYEVWVRPYAADNKILDAWIKSGRFLVPPAAKATLTGPLSEKESHPGGTIAMIVILCILVSILVAVVFYFWKKGFLKKLPTCRVPYHENRETNELETRNNQVPVFPIYYPESEIYMNCVETSIDIFCKHGGLDIKSYAENDVRKAAQAHTDNWIDAQVKNSIIIIFYSDALLKILLKQTDRNNHTYEAICLKALSKINELNNGGAKIVPYIVSFGLESADDMDSFRKQILSNEGMPLFQLAQKNGSALKLVNFDRLVHKVYKSYSSKRAVQVLRDLDWVKDKKASKLLEYIRTLMDFQTCCSGHNVDAVNTETENDESSDEEMNPMVTRDDVVVTGASPMMNGQSIVRNGISPLKKGASPISITNGHVRFSPHSNGHAQYNTNNTISSGYMSIADRNNSYSPACGVRELTFSQPDNHLMVNYDSPRHVPDTAYLPVRADNDLYSNPHHQATGSFDTDDLKHVFFEPEDITGSTDVSMTNLLEGLHQVNQDSY